MMLDAALVFRWKIQPELDSDCSTEFVSPCFFLRYAPQLEPCATRQSVRGMDMVYSHELQIANT
jgi:hypothetical protein